MDSFENQTGRNKRTQASETNVWDDLRVIQPQNQL